ncbi:LOW QUALITY PROTEIN: C3 and PZP-like alpha-2-macroglobulin domain-containing protein 8 [Physella acuta]|uniref:LOW QUALITY PROTEIN: C3 and PZP-like alpha-2-macroglobulin domain-containing protein 8 n=1 Tax=Physella acuta TaxID=109671 RepID=UPI0027DDA8CC|nr:LOW QUALITY PROTEIN: C3 and PZP-like alpha-2-macroglobulin domain-containing protein 8 [Physella acuta]
MSWLLLVSSALLIALTSSQGGGPPREKNCLIDSTAGCSYARAPQYLIIAPKKIRPNQVFQVFATILRMEYNQEFVHVIVSIIKGDTEYANTSMRFDRPSSRIMQLQMPSNAPDGQYRIRVEGRLNEQDTGNIWANETDIDFSTKQASLFIQMSRPLYRQGQIVHFRVIPILPNMMPKYGSMIVYIDDPTGIPVRRWQGLQTNAGGIVSQSFVLSDQPNFGTWNIRVDAFGHVYRHPFLVEEFWEPRFDVNVTVPLYVMEAPEMKIRGVMLANHTSGRPCVGNASITAFFRPREEIWNATKGWEKPYWDAQKTGKQQSRVPVNVPDYRPVSEIPVKDFHMYFAYEYRFFNDYTGRIDFEWTLEELMTIAKRGGESGSLVDSEFVFFANVSDWYSGLNRTGWAGTIMFDNKYKLKWVGEPVRTFKPSSIMKIQVAITKYDGTPVDTGGTITLSYVITDNSGTSGRLSDSQTRTPINGIAQFEYSFRTNVQNVLVTATFLDARKPYSGSNQIYLDPKFNIGTVPSITLRASRYYSPTNSYITILSSTNNPQVNEYMIFHVKTSSFVPRIYYQIVSQSNIIIGDQIEMTSRQKTFAVSLTREMVPNARLVVYYIRQPEEIVTDVLNFFVNGTRQNVVTLGINRGKDFSRDTIEFNAYADPGSYVAFSGMLLDQYSRGLSDGITENRLIDELLTYDATTNGSYRHLWRVSDTEYEYNFFHGPDYGVDTTTSFLSAGLLVLTDARVPRLFNEQFCRVNQKASPCFSGIEGECFTDEQKCNGKCDCTNDCGDEWGCVEPDISQKHLSAMDRVSRVMHFYDNSSWAWQEIFVKPDGRVDFRVDVPKYPLSWVINGVSVSRELGLGIMVKPVRYDAGRYMYMQVEHPQHIIRGEQIGVRVTVFNYWYHDDYLEVLITMHGNDDFEFVSVGEMGNVMSYTPPIHKGDQKTILFLEPGESRDIYMPIVASKDMVRGILQFRVSATCFMQKDEYNGTMYVKPDGVMNYYHTPYLTDFIRYEPSGSPQFVIPVPESFRKLEVPWNLYIPQSAEAKVSLFGDVVTPGFFEDYLHAENTILRPYGGGEMITYNFAYNLLTLKFMKASQQLPDDQLMKSLREMNIALQRILGYMNPDGSMKMFRDDHRPNLWLTAFVAKTVDEANFGEWQQDLFIPRELINKLVLYICSRQNDTTGAFEPDENDVTYDRKMTLVSGLKDDKLRSHPVPLTAYVLIALYDVQHSSEEAAACIDTARRKAADYLFNQVPNIKEVFHMAITTYALTLTRSPRRSPFDQLWAMKRNDDVFMYFSEDIVYPNPFDFLNNVRYIKPRQELMNDAYSVQSTAYALMAHINYNSGLKVHREMMMSWLCTMRNSIGGFASTQDTILAMEALFKFTQVDPHLNVYDLTTTIESTASPNWQSVFTLQKLDYISLKSATLPYDSVWGFIVFDAVGTGRAMLQLTTTVNVEYDFLQKMPMPVENDMNQDVIKFFALYPDVVKFSGRNNSIFEMKLCMSWLYTEKSKTSGLTVMEIDIPTGYVVMNDTLRDYVKSGVVPNLKRAEHYQRKVVFYFDYLDESKTCVYFRADRWYPVANATIQHRMRVYDYYEPGMHNTTMYTTRN